MMPVVGRDRKFCLRLLEAHVFRPVLVLSCLELCHYYSLISNFLKTAPAYVKELISYIKSAGTDDTADIE